MRPQKAKSIYINFSVKWYFTDQSCRTQLLSISRFAEKSNSALLPPAPRWSRLGTFEGRRKESPPPPPLLQVTTNDRKADRRTDKLTIGQAGRPRQTMASAIDSVCFPPSLVSEIPFLSDKSPPRRKHSYFGGDRGSHFKVHSTVAERTHNPSVTP